MLFDRDAGKFHIYNMAGERTAEYEAPGVDYPSPFTTSLTSKAVIYLISRNAAENRPPQVVRAAADGVTKLDISAEYIAALAVSAEEQYFAWGTLGPENGVSELWVSGPGGSGAKIVTSARFEQSPNGAFFLRPLKWTADNKLIFERSLTGIGGYILFGGHNSLYSYDPQTGSFETIIPAEEAHGLCLDSYRLDLRKAAFHCSSSGHEIRIRDLDTQGETTLPALGGQGAAGSLQFSPSGAWVAYAIAANNPDDESGKIVIAPADFSAPPAPIVEITGNKYGVVHGWLDENTLLWSQSVWPNNTLWKVNRDGSGAEQIAAGIWMGMLP